MKIKSIEINCLRGIKNLKLDFNEKNAVIYGDNGTGKSGVIDAIDFLLSGEISRINGTGTSGLTLQSHGKHVKSNPQDAWVSAVVKIPNINENVIIKRTLINHSVLECKNEYKEYFNKVENIAKLQANILSRREITKYISSTDSTRAKDIENLLNLEKITSNRKILQKIFKEISLEYDNKQKELLSIKQDIDKILNTSQDNWLDIINEKRTKLNCNEIDSLNPDLIVKGIDFSKESEIKTALSVKLNDIILYEKEIYGEKGLINNLDNMIKIQTSIQELEQVDMIIDNLELYNKALVSIKDDICPVCEQPIKSKEELINKLRSKIDNLKSLSNLSSKRSNCYSDIKTNISNLIQFYNNNYNNIAIYDTESNIINIKPLFEYMDNLKVESLTKKDCDEYKNRINIHEVINKIKIIITTEIAKISIENIQIEYKDLTNIASRIKTLYQTEFELKNLELSKNKAEILFTSYEKSQEDTLNELYKSIEGRFSFFYRLLHSKDENDFNAEFTKSGAGLEMSVRFLDGKKYPPNAVHSEGHQDSMGICLFFALSELIENDILDIILLDDVVMSIDMDHRITFCKLLNEIFPNKQFIITTHDFIWKKELEIHHVVGPKNIIHFRAWDIDNGPLYEKTDDSWDIIKSNLNAGKKSEAIGKLRYLLEEHFNYICQKYRLLVPYSPDGKWSLEDVIIPAHKFLKSALNKALETIQSLKKDTTPIKNLINNYDNSFKDFNCERWTLNPSTHFTLWAQELSITELIALVEASEKYCNIFKCKICHKEINIIVDNNLTPTSIICPCASTAFPCKKF